MTVEKPSNLVPKLRFPEFQCAGDWKLDQIGNVANITKGKRVSKADITKGGATPCIRYAELYTHYREVIREVVSRTNVPQEDLMLSQAEDVIVPASGETRADIARAACVLLERVALGSDLNVLRSDLYGPFFSYLLNSPLRHTIARVAQGDTVAHLYPKQLSRVWLAYPSRREQQRIADCLGSLDELITSKEQKLEALRQHKQGLIQQIFPKPGETTPRLRFPEFRNAADWKTKILGSQGSFLTSLTGKTAKDFDTGDAAFIPYMNVFSNVFTNTTDLRPVNVAGGESQTSVSKGDVFFTVSSETPEEAGMSSVLLDEIRNCYLNSFCALFRFDEGKSPDPVFLGYLLRSATVREHLLRGAQGATRYNISKATFRSLPILIPSGPEQRKIADCLGPMDEQITAESEKVDALWQHKQGLIQQLFPSLEDQ